MIPPGSYEFGPSNGTMVIRTGRAGMGKKVGHDLVIDVTDWSAKAEVGEAPADRLLTDSADVGSVLVREG
jgi:hypothetical protein